MPDFTYIARDMTGKRVEGALSAGSEREVVASLAAKDLFPLKVDTVQQRQLVVGSGRVRAKTMATVYGQLAALLRSGVPLLRAIEVIRDKSSNAALVKILRDVHDRVQEGDTLAEAMSRHPKAFSELATSIVRAGGEGGFLEEALDRVAKFTEMQDELRSRIIGALAYPVILMTLGTVVVTVLVVFFVPKFEEVFERLRERDELPMVTEWLLGLSNFLQSYGVFFLIGVAILLIALQARFKTPSGRQWLDKWRLRIPQAGTIYLDLAIARFCRVLGTLLQGGVPIVRSLEISSDSTGNKVLSAAIRKAAENISAGESLAAPLQASGHFPPDVVEMIAVAEQSNSLETVLPHIADTLERDTWRRLDLFVRLLEPMMLVVLAGVVLVVVTALLMPVLKMSMTV